MNIHRNILVLTAATLAASALIVGSAPARTLVFSDPAEAVTGTESVMCVVAPVDPPPCAADAPAGH